MCAQFLAGGADVVMVLLATDHAVGRGHGVTAQTAKEQPLEQGIGLLMSVRLAAAVVAKQVLDLIPNSVSDDGLVFAVVDLVLIANLAQVGDVGEELVQRALGERPAATLFPLLRLPALRSPTESIRCLQHPAQRTVLHVQGKELPDLFGFCLIDDGIVTMVGRPPPKWRMTNESPAICSKVRFAFTGMDNRDCLFPRRCRTLPVTPIGLRSSARCSPSTVITNRRCG